MMTLMAVLVSLAGPVLAAAPAPDTFLGAESTSVSREVEAGLPKEFPPTPMIERGTALPPTPLKADDEAYMTPPPSVGAEIWAMVGRDPRAIAAYAAQTSKNPDNTSLAAPICAVLACRQALKDNETLIDSPDGRLVRLAYVAGAVGARNLFSTRDAYGQTTTSGFDVPRGDPLVFDLSGAGVRTSQRLVRYDIDGSGMPEMINEISSGNGLLVFDANKDGIPGANGRELFGNFTDLDGDSRPDGFGDGFEALWGLVNRAVLARVLPAKVLELRLLRSADLAALDKAYGLKIRAGGMRNKTLSLREAGILTISLSAAPTVRRDDFDGEGNSVARREGATFTRADGSQGAYSDVWLSFNAAASRPHLASSRQAR